MFVVFLRNKFVFLVELGFLPEVVEMQECVLCREHITNPLCPECIGEQVKSWLFEVRSDLVSGLDIETSKLSLGLFNNNACISCKKHMDVCTYCYTEHIFEWLEPLVNKEELSEFIRFFHYDFPRKGYYLRAKDLGLV